MKIGKVVAAFGFALLLPVVASAQATISGVARDASGAVLPGVTVEAASPALIEKVRTAVTDGTGQYAIENLRPGLYSVTFTLPGFAAVKREGVELSGTFTARINADMRVGTIEETVTVTGETPVVDVQSTRQERVLDREILDALPNSGLRTALGVLIPSVDFRRQDVGGAGVRAVTGNMVAHGARSEDAGTTLNGMTMASFGTGAATATIFMNPMGLQEITIDTGSNNAELHAGGVRTNYTL
ncbi:MAG TPA: carboxypeptidase-like regulatory domain-containing protein, partial [Gemmatimonadaceae bacterium]|nr:carboxypeptidase-like regulatory domain-containing protein [Gemmatimonadaceae bacterium]